MSYSKLVHNSDPGSLQNIRKYSFSDQLSSLPPFTAVYTLFYSGVCTALPENSPFIARGVTGRRENAAIAIRCRWLITSLALLTLIPPHSLNDTCPYVEQERDKKAQQHQDHRLPKLIDLKVLTVAQRPVKVILWSKVAFSLSLGVTAIAGPLINVTRQLEPGN